MRQQPDQPHRTTLSDPVRVGAGLAGWQLALALIPSYEYKASAGINQGSVSEAETPRPTERCFRRGFLSCLAQLPVVSIASEQAAAGVRFTAAAVVQNG